MSRREREAEGKKEQQRGELCLKKKKKTKKKKTADLLLLSCERAQYSLYMRTETKKEDRRKERY